VVKIWKTVDACLIGLRLGKRYNDIRARLVLRTERFEDAKKIIVALPKKREHGNVA